MKEKLIKYLVCPKCKVDLNLRILKQKDNEIINGIFTCVKCGTNYKIEDGIPIFTDNIKDSKKDIKNVTSSRFGWQWNYFSTFDIDIERKKFLEWIYPTNKRFFENKIVFDAGCGMGRHAIISSIFGAEEVIAIDLGPSVYAAYENTKKFPNIHIIQADIYNLPFNEESFDFIYSIGVIHHLPEPREGFENLLKYLKPNGKINIWVYGRENNGWIIYFLNPIRKYITSKIPPNLLLYLSLIPASILFAAAKFIYKPINKVLLNFYMPYKDYILWISNLTFRSVHLIVFDHLVTPVAFYHKKEDVVEWFEKNGLRNVHISHRRKMSWRASGEKE